MTIRGDVAPGPPGRTRLAAYTLCLDERGRVLLCHIAPSIGLGDIWTLPGGGVEFGEAPIDAALRELTEETGLRGEIIELLDVSDRLFSAGSGAVPLHAIRIVYRVRIVGGDLRDETDGSTDTAGWFGPGETARMRLGELSRHMLARTSGR